jgi:hypothetical protein
VDWCEGGLSPQHQLPPVVGEKAAGGSVAHGMEEIEVDAQRVVLEARELQKKAILFWPKVNPNRSMSGSVLTLPLSMMCNLDCSSACQSGQTRKEATPSFHNCAGRSDIRTG